MNDDDFPIINFSNSKHVDKKTLSRIRSHAQQRVQDQKLFQRIGNAGCKEAVSARPNSTSRNQPGLHLVFEKKTGNEVRRPRGARPGQQPPDASITSKDGHISLGTTLSNKQDPFDCFPILINAELIDLFGHYYLGWQWHHPKSTLFHETIQSPILAYSFLAVAYNICRGDDVRSMHYESRCMQHVANEVGRIANSANKDRQTDICNLLWAICRLATIKVNQGQLETSLNHLNAVALVSPTMTDWDGSEYGAHLRACVAGLLMANCNRLGDVNPVLFAPYNLTDTSAVVGVKAAGFKIPPQAVVLDPAVSGLLTPEVADATLALTAIYNTRALEEDSEDQSPRPVVHAHTGDQAYEGLRIAFRLAKLGLNDNSLVSEHYDWRAAFQDCVRYCALLFPWSFGSRIIKWGDLVAQAHRHNRQYLTPELIQKLREESAYSQSMYDLLLWMLTVLGVSADIEGKEHYASLVRDCFEGVKNRSYEEVLQLAETLPWLDVRTRALAEGFWEVARHPETPRGVIERMDASVADARKPLRYYVVPCVTSCESSVHQ